jgi:hypothetical protein
MNFVFQIKDREFLGQLSEYKVFLCSTKHHAMKAYWGSGGIVPRIL